MWNNGLYQNGLSDNGLYLGPFNDYGPEAVRSDTLVFSVPAGSTDPITSVALGYDVAAALVLSVFRSGTAVGSSPGLSIGAASLEGNRQWNMSGYIDPDESAAASTMTRTALYDNGVASQITTALQGECALSFDGEMITLTPTDAYPADVDILVIAFGGPGVRRARAGTWNIASGTSPQSFVDPDFQPDVLILVGSASAVGVQLNLPQAAFDISISVAVSPNSVHCLALRHVNNTGSPGTLARATTSRFFVGLNSTGGEAKVINLTSFDASGVTLTGVTNSSPSIFGWLALKGPQAALFTAVTQTSAGAFDAVTGLPFQPRRVLLLANPNAAANQSAGTKPLHGMVGTSDGTEQHAVEYHSYDYTPIGAGSRTDPQGARSATRAGINNARTGQGTGSLAGDFTVSDLNENGTITLTQQDGDPLGYLLLGLALGDALPLPDDAHGTASGRRRRPASRLRRARRRR